MQPHVPLLYFNPRSPRGLRPSAYAGGVIDFGISIHAAQEGCDECEYYNTGTSLSISIHAAQEGCDCLFKPQCKRTSVFQSTQPKRAATLTNWFVVFFADISIHAAQEGCDKVYRAGTGVVFIFQSTQPKRAATFTP